MKRLATLFTVLFFAFTAFAQDSDGDGTDDVLDPCVDDDRNTGTAVCDTDADGYGNVCDGDFNQSNTTTSADYTMFFQADSGTGNDSGVGTNMNCSSGNPGVTSTDYTMFFIPQSSLGTPGPSGIACAGNDHCRPNMEAKILQQEFAGGYLPKCSSPFKITGTIGSGIQPDDTPNTPWMGIYFQDRCSVGGVDGTDNSPEDREDVGLPGQFPFNVVRFDFPEADNTYMQFNENTMGTSGRTYGTRVYLRYSSGFGNPSNTGVVELAENLNTGSVINDPGIRFEWADYDTLNMVSGLFSTPHGSVGTVAFAGDAGVDRSDCVDGWCRFEMFYDHDDATDLMTVRARLYVVTGTDAGKSISVEEELPNQVGDPEQGGTKIFYNKNVSAGSWINTESIWISHAAGTELSENPTYWLDRAYEIEGY